MRYCVKNFASHRLCKQAQTGARRAPLKKGAGVPVSTRRRDIHVMCHNKSTRIGGDLKRSVMLAFVATQFVSTLYMEYSVTGKSTDGKVVQHHIQGVYEAPLTGVLDEWLIE